MAWLATMTSETLCVGSSELGSVNSNGPIGAPSSVTTKSSGINPEIGPLSSVASTYASISSV